MSKVAAINYNSTAFSEPVMFSEPIVTEAWEGTRNTTLFGESVKTVVLDEFLSSGGRTVTIVNDMIASHPDLGVWHKALVVLTTIDTDRVIFTDTITAAVDAGTECTTTVVIPRSADVISNIFIKGGIPFTVRFTPLTSENGEVILGDNPTIHEVVNGEQFKRDIAGSELVDNILSIVVDTTGLEQSEITIELEYSLLKGDFRKKVLANCKYSHALQLK